jgi:methionyl aminopeptidase
MRERRPPRVRRKAPAELEMMRRSGQVLERTLEVLREALVPGATTAELDALAEAAILEAGAVPSFKGYNGYPATICVEIEDVVVHGIPSPDEVLREGTVVGVDVGCALEGWHADAAFTAGLGEVDEVRGRLLRVTEEALGMAMEAAQVGNRLAEVSQAVQGHVEAAGFGVVRALVGHGIGARMHEPPQVPNFYEAGEFGDYEVVLRPGMTLAVEPMVTAGTWEIRVDADGWTTRTADGKPAAHFEHTVAITRDGPEILARGV